MKRLLLSAAAVLALAAPAYADKLFALSHTNYGYYCEPVSLKDTVLVFNEAARMYNTPAPQVDYDTGAKTGSIIVTYVDPNDYIKKANVFFSYLSVCNMAAKIETAKMH